MDGKNGGNSSGDSASKLTVFSYVERCIEGSVGGAMNVLMLYPIYKITARQMIHGSTIRDAARTIRTEGALNLYRGVLPPLCQNACRSALMFANYRFFSTFIQHKLPNLDANTSKCIAAALTASSEAILFTPFERLLDEFTWFDFHELPNLACTSSSSVQTLLINEQFNEKIRNTFHSMRIIWKKYGILEFYRGCMPVTCRNCLGTFFYFRVLEHLETMYPPSEIGVESFTRDFIVGGLIAATGSSITYPLNVIKVRMQSELGGEFKGMKEVLKLIYIERDKKLLNIYRGAHLNILKSFFGWGIQTAFVKLFGSVS